MRPVRQNLLQDTAGILFGSLLVTFCLARVTQARGTTEITGHDGPSAAGSRPRANETRAPGTVRLVFDDQTPGVAARCDGMLLKSRAAGEPSVWILVDAACGNSETSARASISGVSATEKLFCLPSSGKGNPRLCRIADPLVKKTIITDLGVCLPSSLASLAEGLKPGPAICSATGTPTPTPVPVKSPPPAAIPSPVVDLLLSPSPGAKPAAPNAGEGKAQLPAGTLSPSPPTAPEIVPTLERKVPVVPPAPNVPGPTAGLTSAPTVLPSPAVVPPRLTVDRTPAVPPSLSSAPAPRRLPLDPTRAPGGSQKAPELFVPGVSLPISIPLRASTLPPLILPSRSSVVSSGAFLARTPIAISPVRTPLLAPAPLNNTVSNRSPLGPSLQMPSALLPNFDHD